MCGERAAWQMEMVVQVLGTAYIAGIGRETGVVQNDSGQSYTLIYSPYRAVNTLRLGYKTGQLMLYREIMAVCSEIHTKHINTLCGQNVELLNVKLAVHIVTTGLQRVKSVL